VSDRRRRVQRLGIFAVIVAMHVALSWLLLTASRSVQTTFPSLELMLLPTSRPAANPAMSEISAARRNRSRRSPGRAEGMASGMATQTPSAALENAGPVRTPPPPVNWNDELERAARESVPPNPPDAPRKFGFPERAARAPAKADEFGWDSARTHRVESLPTGGLLIHLNDECVLVLAPLPLAFCGIGKKAANGDLFKHLRDAPLKGEPSEPK
jgi:hypothetical protein